MSFRRFRKLAFLGLAFVFIASSRAGSYGQTDAGSEFMDSGASSGSSSQPRLLTPHGQALLRSILQAGELPDLQQPVFSGHQSEVIEFYDGLGGTLPWIRQGKPTSQARMLIRAFEDAEYKGLRPQDYDGSRWNARLARIERPPVPSESELVRFDLALTICAATYVSDLRDLTGDFCTSGSERESTLEERWYAHETVQAGAGRNAAAAN